MLRLNRLNNNHLIGESNPSVIKTLTFEVTLGLWSR